MKRDCLIEISLYHIYPFDCLVVCIYRYLSYHGFPLGVSPLFLFCIGYYYIPKCRSFVIEPSRGPPLALLYVADKLDCAWLPYQSECEVSSITELLIYTNFKMAD